MTAAAGKPNDSPKISPALLATIYVGCLEEWSKLCDSTCPQSHMQQYGRRVEFFPRNRDAPRRRTDRHRSVFFFPPRRESASVVKRAASMVKCRL
ncbi:hypothetical protein GN956_G20980 [Arapaima gigas]